MESDKLNLGCGGDIKKGYVNVDILEGDGIDKIWNLNNLPYPFKKNQFREINMQNVLEHLNNPYDVMLEIHRICSKNAKVFIRAPHFSSDNAWGNLQHKRGFNTQTFLGSNISNLFQVVKQEITFPHIKFFARLFAKINPLFYEKHFAYIFSAVDLVIELRAKK